MPCIYKCITFTVYKNTNTMTTLFNTLSNETAGTFTYEPTELIEITVSLVDASIRVDTFRSANHMIDAISTKKYHSLHGVIGATVEEKFNEIINAL